MSNKIACSSLLNNLERLTRRLTEIVERDFSVPQPLSNALINWRSHKECWSIAECLLHLNYYADDHFDPIISAITQGKKKKRRATKHYKQGKLGKFYVERIKISEENSIQSHRDSSKKYRPSSKSNLDGAEIMSDFLQNQQALLQILKDARHLPLGKIRIPYRFWGVYRIQLGDILQILVFHTERHIVQAQRILYHDDFPANQ